MAKGNGTTSTIDVASLPTRKKRTRRVLTSHERYQLVDSIKQAVAKGATIKAACKQAGIYTSMYSKWIANERRYLKVSKGNGKAPPAAEPAVMITLLIQNQPITVSLDDAIRIQQGLGQLLKFQR